MDKAGILSMLLGFPIFMAAVTAATFSSSTEPPYYSSSSYIDGEYHHTPAGTTNSLQPHYSVSNERTLEEEHSAYQLTSSTHQRDVEALLLFRKGITLDPLGSLSNWTAENSQNVCSWSGVFSCDPDTNRVYNLGLTGLGLRGLANCTQLRLLDLRKNNFTGELPRYLTSFQNLRVLSVGYNNIEGNIYEWITNLSRLQVLDLSNNKLSGRIPSNVGRLQGFGILGSSQVSGDTLYEDVQIEIKGFEYTITYVLRANTIFDLSNNNFIGEIPSSMGNLSTLRLLNLSGNQLDGKIPASLSEISTLEQLDLAKNNLSGEIPQELSKLTKLASLDVAFNRLCGRIPQGTQFDTFNTTSFQGNKCLCKYPLHPCKETKSNDKKTDGVSANVTKGQGWLSRVKEHISLIALVLGVGIGFGGVVILIIMWDKAWYWIVLPNKKSKPFYGVYRLPT